ncbi:MAG TPA: NAD(P)H-binding protein [Candidatus Limnocylindria bacterium]|jgi:NADH dehydrogenase
MGLRVAITGANGYTGRFVAERLVAEGHAIVNLTNHPDRPADAPVAGTGPLAFEDPAALARGLAGVDVLVNTYWVRYPRGEVTFERAVENIGRLATAAARAGVRRIVHVSIAKAGESELPYYRGKLAGEAAVRASGVPAAIVRPTILFGESDVLMNNIAWAMRHLPVFGVPGDGSYPIQPIHVRDHAELIASLVTSDDTGTHDSQGPERYTFTELLRMVRWAIGSHTLIVRMPPPLAQLGAWGIGLLQRDVMMTPDELRGLMDGLLSTDASPAGHTSLAQWLRAERATIGKRYASELDRHFRQAKGPGVAGA